IAVPESTALPLGSASLLSLLGRRVLSRACRHCKKSARATRQSQRRARSLPPLGPATSTTAHTLIVPDAAVAGTGRGGPGRAALGGDGVEIPEEGRDPSEMCAGHPHRV